jgi:CMP-N,N'-diacetyllegionaminic acid synthase
MNILGLITARAGSKGIPGKNVALLRGRPLMTYTCEAAVCSATLSRVLLSTDSPELANLGRLAGVAVPFMRPRELAEDTTPSLDVVVHALEWLRAEENWSADVVVLLQPTSPLRTARHIDEAVALLLSSDSIETVVSVVQVPHRYNPFSIMNLRGGRLEFYMPDPVPFDRFRRQNLPPFFARNGPAVLVVRTEVLKTRRSFYGEHVSPYPMSRVDSLDIDEAFDLVVAEAALEYRARAERAPSAGAE